MTHRYQPQTILFAERVLRDDQGVASFISVLDDVHTNVFPSFLPRLTVIGAFYGIEPGATVRLRMKNPKGETAVDVPIGPLQLKTDSSYHQFFVNVVGIELIGPGNYVVTFEDSDGAVFAERPLRVFKLEGTA